MVDVRFDRFIGLNTEVKIILHPDGEHYIYSAGANVIIANINNSHSFRIFRGHDDFVTSLAISNNGDLIASGQRGTNSNVIVWNFDNMETLFCFEEHDYMIQCLEFSKDDHILVSMGSIEDGKLFFLDVSNGSIIASTNVSPRSTCVISGGFVKDIKKRDTDKYLFATGGLQGMMLWSLDPCEGVIDTAIVSGDPRAAVSRQVTSIAFSIDTEILYGATTSGDFVLANIRTQRIFQVVTATKMRIDSIVASNDMGVVIGCGDSTIKYFNSQLLCIGETKTDGHVRCVSFNMNNPDTMIASTAVGSILRINRQSSSNNNNPAVHQTNNYNNNNYANKQQPAFQPIQSTVVILSESHTKKVVSVAYSPRASDRLATASIDGTLRVWDIAEHTVLATGTGRRDQGNINNVTIPNCMIFTDTQLLISGWTDGKVLAHSADTGECFWMIPNTHIAAGGVSCLAISLNRRFILTGGYTGEIRLWELRSRQMMANFKDHNSQVTGIVVVDGDAAMISCSRDRSIIRTDLVKERRQYAHTQRIGGVNAISQNAIISVGQEKRLTCWNCNMPDPVYSQPLQSEEDKGRCIAISHSGTLIATGGSAGILRIWKFGTWERIASLTGHSSGSGINSVSFSSDDRQIATGGDDGCVFTWNLFYQ